ncbi:MAG: cyclase family protein [Clostridia bacterium]|nr:cyclase family protein [Clostridia bacterium]
MTILDISKELCSAPLFGENPPAKLIPFLRINEGGPCNVSELSLNLHTATHCDAYMHFIRDGADIVDTPLAHFVGECYVLSVEPNSVTQASDLKGKLPAGIKRLLLHCGENGFISEDAAEFLAEEGIITFGTEAPSVGAPGHEGPVHVALLGNKIAIIEQLDLSGVQDGTYTLFAQPLKIAGAEAAPCRALLVKE